MLRNVENQGDPWGPAPGQAHRLDPSLDFEVPVSPGPIPDDIEYLYWVGCAGALDERARKGVQATAAHAAPGRGHLRDPGPRGVLQRRLRRAASGNEFLFQELAAAGRRHLGRAVRVWRASMKIVATCPHCFNTLGTSTGRSAPNYRCCTTPSCSTGWSATRSSSPSPRFPGHHLPRPVLPGPAQPGLRGAARGDQRRGSDLTEMPRHGAQLLLRGRRRACGWRSTSASASTSNASTRRWCTGAATVATAPAARSAG